MFWSKQYFWLTDAFSIIYRAFPFLWEKCDFSMEHFFIYYGAFPIFYGAFPKLYVRKHLLPLQNAVPYSEMILSTS